MTAGNGHPGHCYLLHTRSIFKEHFTKKSLKLQESCTWKKKTRRLFYSPTDTRSQGRIHTHTDAHAHTLALCPFGSSVLVFPSSIKLRYFRLRCIQYSPSSLSQVTVSGGSNLIPAQNLWEPFFNRELSSLVSDAAHSFKLVFISLWHGIFFFFLGPHILDFCLVLVENTSFEFGLLARNTWYPSAFQRQWQSSLSPVHHVQFPNYVFTLLVITNICRTFQSMQRSCSSKFPFGLAPLMFSCLHCSFTMTAVKWLSSFSMALSLWAGFNRLKTNKPLLPLSFIHGVFLLVLWTSTVLVLYSGDVFFG